MSDPSNLATFTFWTASDVYRGDYVKIADGTFRVIRATRTTATARKRHPNRLAEWLHRRSEDWALWPLADLKAKFTVRP